MNNGIFLFGGRKSGCVDVHRLLEVKGFIFKGLLVRLFCATLHSRGTPTYSSNLYFYSVSLNTWTLKSSVSAPSGRQMHTAVLDAANRRMYIFGGGTRSSSSSTANSLLSDLFRYDVASDSWTQLTGHTTPRARHAAVWDSNSDRMIVFGGEADDKTKLGDVLEYDPASDTWSSPTISGSAPVARVEPVAVWDATSNSMLMCCGEGDVDVYSPFTDSTASAYNDLWSYVRGSGWTELVQSGSFTQRYAVAAAWDAAARSLVGFGGATYLQYSPTLSPPAASVSMMFQERRTAAGQCGILPLGTSTFLADGMHKQAATLTSFGGWMQHKATKGRN